MIGRCFLAFYDVPHVQRATRIALKNSDFIKIGIFFRNLHHMSLCQSPRRHRSDQIVGWSQRVSRCTAQSFEQGRPVSAGQVTQPSASSRRSFGWMDHPACDPNRPLWDRRMRGPRRCLEYLAVPLQLLGWWEDRQLGLPGLGLQSLATGWGQCRWWCLLFGLAALFRNQDEELRPLAWCRNPVGPQDRSLRNSHALWSPKPDQIDLLPLES